MTATSCRCPSRSKSAPDTISITAYRQTYLNEIHFRCSAPNIVRGTRVVLPWASAARQALTRKAMEVSQAKFNEHSRRELAFITASSPCSRLWVGAVGPHLRPQRPDVTAVISVGPETVR